MFNLRGSTAEGVEKTNLGIHIHTHTHTYTHIAFNSSHSSYINVANSVTGLTTSTGCRSYCISVCFSLLNALSVLCGIIIPIHRLGNQGSEMLVN